MQWKPVNLVALHLSKAFDSVSHSVLLGKLSSMQLDESIILLGEQLAHGSGVRDCSKCGYLSHQWGSAGLHSRAGVFINYMDAGIECTLSLSMIPGWKELLAPSGVGRVCSEIWIEQRAIQSLKALRKLRGDLIAVYNSQRASGRRCGRSLVTSNRTQGDGIKVVSGKVQTPH